MNPRLGLLILRTRINICHPASQVARCFSEHLLSLLLTRAIVSITNSMVRSRLLLGLRLLHELITLTFRFPYWIVRNIPRSLRGRPSWSLRKAVHVEFQRRLYIVATRQDLFSLLLACAHQPGFQVLWSRIHPGPYQGHSRV